MGRKSGCRFSEKIMLHQRSRARWRFNVNPSLGQRLFIEGGGATPLYERIEPIVAETPAIYECTVEVGDLTATLAFVNSTRWSPSPRHPAAASWIPMRGSQNPRHRAWGFLLRRSSLLRISKTSGLRAPFGLFPFACFAGYDSPLARAKP
jgi:hypothetical protein